MIDAGNQRSTFSYGSSDVFLRPWRLAHLAPPLDLRPLLPIKHEQKDERQSGQLAEAEEEEPELWIRAAVAGSRGAGACSRVSTTATSTTTPATGSTPLGRPSAASRMLQPYTRVDADTQSSSAGLVFLKAIDDGKMSHGTRLSGFVDSLC